MLLWMASIALSVSFLVVTAAVGLYVPAMATAHLVIAGLVSTVIALLAFADTRKMIQAGAPEMKVAGSLMRYMGLIWAWLALVISVTYGTSILEWSGWWQYFLSFIVLAGLCLFMSRILRDADEFDAHILRISRYIGCVTLFGTMTALAVFAVNRVNMFPAETHSWAASNVFVFGALALAAVSSYMLKASANQAK